jgi:hypothetical protein
VHGVQADICNVQPPNTWKNMKPKQVRVCVPCGRRDESDGMADTCPFCGEGSWMQIDVDPELALQPMPVSEPKRKGRR